MLAGPRHREVRGGSPSSGVERSSVPADVEDAVEPLTMLGKGLKPPSRGHQG